MNSNYLSDFRTELKTFEIKLLAPLEKRFNFSLTDTLIKNYSKILESGQTNFDKEYSAKMDKVLLYLNTYFSMHATSNYYLYDKISAQLLDYINDRQCHFIDIGCGPATSGFAFKVFIENFVKNRNYHVTYTGIDISKNMRDAAKWILSKYNIFKKYAFSNNTTGIIDHLKKIRHSKLSQSIIINYSFVLASKSINIDDLVTMTQGLINDFNNNSKLMIIYHNPVSSNKKLHENWIHYRNKLIKLNIGIISDIKNTIPYKFNSKAFPKYRSSSVDYQILRR